MISRMMAEDCGVTYCKNCGHESHCGTKKMIEHRDHNGTSGMIEACKFCRCPKCTAPDWG